MNEIEIEKSLMDLWVELLCDTKPKEKCLEIAQKFDEMAKYYDGIINNYQKRADHYRDLKRQAQLAAVANRALTEKKDQ